MSKVVTKVKLPPSNIKKFTPVKAAIFNVTLKEEQKLAKAEALQNDVIVFTGKPGTSKSLLSCNIALDLLLTGKVSKIIVTRPMVDVGKSMGFLPGDAFDFKEGKSAPYLAPVLQAMCKLKSKVEIDNLIEIGKIEIVPIQFVRGLNFEDCVVLVDESQNCTTDELKAIATRLCVGSKLIFTSDVNQIDLLNRHSSAGYFFNKIKTLKGVIIIELLENFRSKLALSIMDKINEYDDERKERREEPAVTVN